MKLPDFIIIGAMKAGSTALMRNLFAHPQITGPAYYRRNRELHYFDILIEEGVPLEHYTRFFDGPCAGEKTPAYLFLPQCAARVGKMVPDARLVAILRHPVERAYSNFRWCRRNRFTAERTFESWLEAERRREELLQNNPLDHAAYRPFQGSLNLGFQRGLYAEQLERFLRYYSRERILIIISERYRKDPVSHMRQLYAFLGVPPHDPPDGYVDERTRYEPMPNDTRAELIERYRPHNQRLFELLGYEIEEWSS